MQYKGDTIGELRVAKDFLPPPDQLVLRKENVKITISLSKSSVTFFKLMARKNRTQYQKMIRSLLDHYASQHQKPLHGTPRSRAGHTG